MRKSKKHYLIAIPLQDADAVEMIRALAESRELTIGRATAQLIREAYARECTKETK